MKPPLPESAWRAIRDAYLPQGAEPAWERVDTGLENTCLKLSGPGGPLFVKVFLKETDRFARTEILMRPLLRRAGLTPSGIITTAAGSELLQFEGGQAIAFNCLDAATPDPADPGIQAAVGAILARLHALPVPGILDPYFDRGIAEISPGEVARVDCRDLRGVLSRARALLTREGPPPPRVTSHGDPQIANFLPRGDALVLVDLEFACAEPPMHDLTRALLYNCCPGGALDFAAASAFLDGYAGAAAQPLPAAPKLFRGLIMTGAVTALWRYQTLPPGDRRYRALLDPVLGLLTLGETGFSGRLDMAARTG